MSSNQYSTNPYIGRMQNTGKTANQRDNKMCGSQGGGDAAQGGEASKRGGGEAGRRGGEGRGKARRQANKRASAKQAKTETSPVAEIQITRVLLYNRMESM